MTEYSPCPGRLRSNDREVTDEPCTKNSPGREGSPAFGAPSRLRYIHRGTSLFFAQYSLLQISPPSSALASCLDAASVPATRPSPAPLMTARRASGRSKFVMVFSLSAREFLSGARDTERSRRRIWPEVTVRRSAERGTAMHECDQNRLAPGHYGSSLSAVQPRGLTAGTRTREERRETPTHRCRTCRTDAVRIVSVPDADSDPDRGQRRILSRPAERAAARGRGTAAGDGRRSRRQTGAEPAPVFPVRRRHGRLIRRDERSLRAAVRSDPGGSRHSGDGRGARRRAQGPVHHGHAHPFP